MDRQIGVLDRRTGPDSAHDLVPRDEIAMLLDQRPEHMEGAAADIDRDLAATLRAPEKSAAAPVETEIAEPKNLRRARGIHVLFQRWGSQRTRALPGASTAAYALRLTMDLATY